MHIFIIPPCPVFVCVCILIMHASRHPVLVNHRLRALPESTLVVSITFKTTRLPTLSAKLFLARTKAKVGAAKARILAKYPRYFIQNDDYLFYLIYFWTKILDHILASPKTLTRRSLE